MLSNKNKIGFATTLTATSPTFVPRLTEPVHVKLDKPHTKIKASGDGTSSDIGVYTEKNGFAQFSASFHLTPTVFFWFTREFSGKLSATTTLSSPARKQHTVNAGGNSAALGGSKSYSLIRPIAIFHTDGTNTTRYEGSCVKFEIEAARNSQIKMNCDFIVWKPNTSGITFPSTFTESGVLHMFSTQQTSITADNNLSRRLDKSNIRDWKLIFDSNVSEVMHMADKDNPYRIEGGGLSVMFEIDATFDRKILSWFEESQQNHQNMTITVDGDQNSQIQFVANNSIWLNEWEVNTALDEVQSETATLCMASPSGFQTVTTVLSNNDVILS